MMDLTELQSRTAVLAEEDDPVVAALDALDEQLSAWVKALGALESYRINIKPALEERPKGLTTAAPARPPERNEPSKEPPADAARAPAEAGSDDEALLASLDPQLAERIRAKWRVSGKQRSVRELLAEMESGAGRGGKKR